MLDMGHAGRRDHPSREGPTRFRRPARARAESGATTGVLRATRCINGFIPPTAGSLFAPSSTHAASPSAVALTRRGPRRFAWPPRARERLARSIFDRPETPPAFLRIRRSPLAPASTTVPGATHPRPRRETPRDPGSPALRPSATGKNVVGIRRPARPSPGSPSHARRDGDAPSVVRELRGAPRLERAAQGSRGRAPSRRPSRRARRPSRRRVFAAGPRLRVLVARRVRAVSSRRERWCAWNSAPRPRPWPRGRRGVCRPRRGRTARCRRRVAQRRAVEAERYSSDKPEPRAEHAPSRRAHRPLRSGRGERNRQVAGRAQATSPTEGGLLLLRDGQSRWVRRGGSIGSSRPSPRGARDQIAV